ncbi:hypothetical protein GE21DRAFT_5017 [Neurospora crassa]|uniref:Uncharacterized protein n=1 Tax=Neurospora crassa (strain ATCC 24698 / 74-OR23-1A / CBS 708.71 / DSM 1257 / FGSC 987) TaxID=367110 RepID=Q7S3K8_NEUCR|nr:hypothetical protein NCU08235 [Neurospora crassa OR74A]EAA30089.1 hypothetical protein NCU08235 [Neurospora crassa OR74A]KHE86491.1 hypothetical protein GE21DRAFT_5017 [Neurospora crassa]|eukprot:XP_959325.1 hypothetical protein NCU08235 [Neurospora crassa OR74A]
MPGLPGQQTWTHAAAPHDRGFAKRSDFIVAVATYGKLRTQESCARCRLMRDVVGFRRRLNLLIGQAQERFITALDTALNAVAADTFLIANQESHTAFEASREAFETIQEAHEVWVRLDAIDALKVQLALPVLIRAYEHSSEVTDRTIRTWDVIATRLAAPVGVNNAYPNVQLLLSLTKSSHFLLDWVVPCLIHELSVAGYQEQSRILNGHPCQPSVLNEHLCQPPVLNGHPCQPSVLNGYPCRPPALNGHLCHRPVLNGHLCHPSVLNEHLCQPPVLNGHLCHQAMSKHLLLSFLSPYGPVNSLLTPLSPLYLPPLDSPTPTTPADAPRRLQPTLTSQPTDVTEKGCSARVHQPRGRKCATHLKNKARYRPNSEADRKRRETEAAGRTVCAGCDRGVAGRGPKKYCWKCFHMRGVTRLERNGLNGICPGCLYKECPNRQFGRENHRHEELYSDSDEDTQGGNDAPEEDDVENNDRESKDEESNDRESSEKENTNEEHAVLESIDKKDSGEEADIGKSNNEEDNNDQTDNKDDNTEVANRDEGNDSEDDRWEGWHRKFCLQSEEQGKGYCCRGCLWTGCPNRKRGHFDLDYNVWEVFPDRGYDTEQEEDDDDEYENNEEADADEDEDEYGDDDGGDEDEHGENRS